MIRHSDHPFEPKKQIIIMRKKIIQEGIYFPLLNQNIRFDFADKLKNQIQVFGQYKVKLWFQVV